MQYTVAAVDEALAILVLVASQPNLGVSELARRSGNTKARTFRLLSTLEGRRFVERHGDPAVYRLGNQTLIMGLAAQEQIGLASLAQPQLQALRDLFNETVQIRIRDGLESVCIALLESTHDLRVSTRIGKRRPLYAGASGKAILAFSDEETQKQVLGSEMVKFTSSTTTQKTKLLLEVKKIREQGFATSLGEVTPDVRSISVPVFDADGSVAAAMGMSFPDSRVSEKTRNAMTEALLKRASALSRDLGHRG